jgi:DNA-binding response OmpR family regulator
MATYRPAHVISLPSEHLPSGTPPLPDRTVLYVEDHPVNVLLMQALFTKRPYARLVVATDGESGLRSALAEPPELLLLDLRLPDCHGTELLQRMRQHSVLADVPAVAVTAEDRAWLAHRAFVEVWHKPLDLRSTLLRLDFLLDRRRVQRAQPDEAGASSPGVPGWTPSIGLRRSATPAPIPFPTASRGPTSDTP